MTGTQITDICAVRMEESRTFPVLCAEAQMCRAGPALEEERAALGKAAVGMQLSYFQCAALILFRFLQGGGCSQTLCIVRQEGLGFSLLAMYSLGGNAKYAPESQGMHRPLFSL